MNAKRVVLKAKLENRSDREGSVDSDFQESQSQEGKTKTPSQFNPLVNSILHLRESGDVSS